MEVLTRLWIHYEFHLRQILVPQLILEKKMQEKFIREQEEQSKLASWQRVSIDSKVLGGLATEVNR